MIPPKLLVYRRTHSDANVDTLPETWRRKKSCGDLFQNGYRVRQGHHRQEDRDKRTGPAPLRVLFNWGKSLIIGAQIDVHQRKPCASKCVADVKHLPSFLFVLIWG